MTRYPPSWPLRLGVLALLLLAAAHLLLPSLAALVGRDPALARLVLIELRLPRTLLVVGYGATLGLSGAALQAVFANPLASPDLTGSSSGAAVGAILGAYWLALASPLAIALCGAAGAAAALVLLLGLAGRHSGPGQLLLAGLAISLVGGAVAALLLALAPSPFAFYDSLDWLMGSFSDKSLPQVATALAPALACSALLLWRAPALDRLALGEDSAAALGDRPRRLARQVVALCALAIGACVSVAGAIGFIGLVAPVVARRWCGGLPGRAMAPAAVMGALLMLVADLALRLAPAGRPIPVGVLTALVGAPLFAAMIGLGRRRWAA